MNYEYFEAWDAHTDTWIYSGSSKREMIMELLDYIDYQNHIDDTLITEQDVRDLNRFLLNKIGIKIYLS